MSVIDPGLFSVMQLFPEEKKRLRQLFLHSQSFRTLCRDFGRCESVLAYWQDAEHERAREICQEYDVLKRSLETEISDYLQHGALKQCTDQLQ